LPAPHLPVQVNLRRRGLALEYATLGWNAVGVAVLAVAAVRAGSVALAGFGLDSLIEIGASIVVVWQLSDRAGRKDRERLALNLIRWAFALLAAYLMVQSVWALVVGHHAAGSLLGAWWTAVTAAVMLALAGGKLAVGRALGNPVLRAEGRVTFVDAMLALAVLAGLIGDGAAGWWWADPVAGLVLVGYALREATAAMSLPFARSRPNKSRPS
jgi:divalent metal cation (Fe/Co/Zn/Cd) transporter